MTLFAALGEKSTAQTSTCSPPTAIQLHSHHTLDFVHNRITNESSETPSEEGQTAKNYRHSLLSYQAVQTQQDEEERTHNKPDLGVWNCSLNNEFDDASLGAMLKSVILIRGGETLSTHPDGQEEEKKDATAAENENSGESAKDNVTTNTVVMTVHLEELEQVHPTVERMRNIVINAYQDLNIAGKGTTPIPTLQSCPFGKCQIKQEVVPKSGGVALVLAVIVPSSKQQGNASTEYQEKQKQSFVVYHLHKFALEVNCTLCFVKEGNDAANEGEVRSIPTMTVEALSTVVRRLAMGLPPLEDNSVLFGESSEEPTESNEEGKDSSDKEASATEPAIYPPGSHDAELISGAMQRNASCEGMWDASTDDLGKALPIVSTTTIDSSSKDSISKGGDEEWLSKLASSVGITVDTTKDSAGAGAAEEGKTPVEKKKEAVKKKKSSKSAASSKSEKAPSDFFANLLKK